MFRQGVVVFVCVFLASTARGDCIDGFEVSGSDRYFPIKVQGSWDDMDAACRETKTDMIGFHANLTEIRQAACGQDLVAIRIYDFMYFSEDFDQEGSGPKCSRILQSGVNSTQRTQVVAAHNKLRARVASGSEGKGSSGGQPSAANMCKMEWDDELAKVAQRWADQCDFGHDACRDVARFHVGQNAYQSSTTGTPGGPNWKHAVQAWYDEVEDFDKRDIAPFKFTSGTGHYTQVVWADTKKVGCGFTQFSQGGWTNSLYICNYGPAGNVLRTPMYEKGPACSRCPKGTKCQDSLCG